MAQNTELDVIALAAIVMGKWADAGLIDGDDTVRQGGCGDDPEWRKAKLAVAAVRPDEYTPDDVVVLAREAAAVLRGFYDDLTPCIHRLKRGERCALCGRARALLVECDGIVSDAHNDGPGSASG